MTSGPNEGLILEGPSRTDSTGQAVFTYSSTKVGTDTVLAQSIVVPASLPLSRGVMLAMNDVNVTSDIIPSFGVMLASNDSTIAYESLEATAEVTWSGGPDLSIPLFVPPIIKTEGGNPIYITDITQNNGDLATISAGPSITRYYLSEDNVIDPEMDVFIGERNVPALEPGELSESIELQFLIPDDLPAGTYYCGACADADNIVAELDEENNCLNNEVAVVASLARSSNQLPDCTSAHPILDLLWPPNHKLKTISILGVTDPDEDRVNITVTGITQDEPVNGQGDGDTSPDGFGVGTALARIRAERSGTGNGRVYAVQFNAGDGKGGVCTGQVTVGVPHDQGNGNTPIDDGQLYDSTQP